MIVQALPRLSAHDWRGENGRSTAACGEAEADAQCQQRGDDEAHAEGRRHRLAAGRVRG